METLDSHPHRLAALRRFLLTLILLSLCATATELLLVGHTEDAWQWVPLALIALALPAAGWLAAAPRAGIVRAWQGLMALFLASGCLGLFLHAQAKMEFMRESNPSADSLSLFWAGLKTQSPPTLAPGIMIQTGLLGLAYAFRHPALGRGRAKSKVTGENE